VNDVDLADRIVQARAEQRIKEQTLGLDDFVAYLPTHSYIFTPTREIWTAAGVNAGVTWPLMDDKPVSPSSWIDQHKPVEGMTWAPGEPMLIADRLIVKEGGWIQRPGCTTFNLYHPPTIKHGDPNEAAPWVNHVVRVYGGQADHIIQWLAHRVQKPAQKINHAIVLGGSQGIGKDTILEPVKHAIGQWNFQEVSPVQILNRFNSFIKAVILRVSEGRDLGDVDRYAFYEHMKVYTAAPPDVLRCDEKHLREHPVVNVCGVVITTNHKMDGLYLPPDDRRHYVAWSGLTQQDFTPEYWNDLWGWYPDGGIEHVAAYLATMDITDFDPKAPPPKTEAWHDIVNAGRAPEDAELADVLDAMGRPPAITLDMLIAAAETIQRHEFVAFLKDRKNRRVIPHRLENADYSPVRNPDDRRDGQWRINGKRQTVYAHRNLPERDRLNAARSL